MKKILLFSFILFGITTSLKAQCTPGTNFADSLFGAWPDTTTNFPNALYNVAYSTDLNFKVPSDAGDIDSAYLGNTIVDFSVDSVVGLPIGMNYTCNVSSCTYAGGSNGCAQISGICSEPGLYNITIHITANLSIFGFIVPVPYSFAGYHINVGEVGIIENEKNEVHIYPNPANEKLIFNNLNPSFEKIEIQNSEGKILKTINSQSSTSFEEPITSLNSGVYFVKIYTESKQEIFKFVKE